MLELPGITRTGDAEQDVDKILRYLARFVPQLQMELEDAKADRYGEEIFSVVRDFLRIHPELQDRQEG